MRKLISIAAAAVMIMSLSAALVAPAAAASTTITVSAGDVGSSWFAGILRIHAREGRFHLYQVLPRLHLALEACK